MSWRERLGLTSNLYSAVVWLVYTLVGLGFAVGAGGMATLLARSYTYGDLTDGGQFAVFTASMLVGTYYVVHKPTSLRLPGAEWFGVLSLIGLVFAALVVAFATLQANGVEINGEPVNPQVFRWPSIGLFSASVVMAFIAVWLDNERSRPAPREGAKRHLEDLRTEFNKASEANSGDD